MKQVIASSVLTVLSGTVAEADFRTKAVSAGQTTQVAVYRAWDPVSCDSAFAMVKVIEKPKSGKLSNAHINTIIPISRFSSRPGPCFGKPTRGFASSTRP